MAPTRNARVLFAAIPEGFPIPGKTTVYDSSQKIVLGTVPLNGGFLIKTLVLSIDPYMRARMRMSTEKDSYSAPFVLGAPLKSHGVGLVLRSENPDVTPGKYVYGVSIPHQEYSVLPNMEELIFLEKDPNLPWTVYVGAAGMPGKTAYMAWKEYSQAKKDETAFITTGAGAVGSMVIQLAKRDGLKVIACAGSEEKVKFIQELGADVAFNYKTTDMRTVLAREGPINIFWDNVGGDALDAALEHAAVYARFLECGMISAYNTGYRGSKKLHYIFTKSITVNGFVVFRMKPKYDTEFYETIPRLLASGELKYREEVSRGLETVGHTILRIMEGKNTGKAVVAVAEE
ncbi:alcohol dehydrogenase [Mycena albidolilacea]|uniref:Alcohol dehydrogenase n=1 Tax=Mycena albidolilacea TaxID=1033008 RepID=A0AAD7APL8_9AGAR|nr:alcohol dehydrogenase [Mycena albidolilacea]